VHVVTDTRQPRLSTSQALEAGRQALGLITAHEDRLRHRGVDEEFRKGLAHAVRVLENGTAVARHRPPVDHEATRAQVQRDLYDWIVSFREAIERRFAENFAMRQTFGVGLPLSLNDTTQICEHAKMIVAVAREHMLQVEAAGIVPEDLTEAERMLEPLAAMRTPAPLHDESSSVKSARRDARDFVERAVDRVLGAAAMEFRREPTIKDLFFSILPHSGDHAGAGNGSGTGNGK
jgi:hypothetical protein